MIQRVDGTMSTEWTGFPVCQTSDLSTNATEHRL